MEGDSRKSSRRVLSQALLSSTSGNSVGNQQRGEPQNVNWNYSDPGLGADSLPSAGVSASPPGGAAPPDATATVEACTVHVAGEGEPRSCDLSTGRSDPTTEVEKDKCFPLQGGHSSTSVSLFLGQLAVGNTIKGEAWKLTRAVVHLEDAWKGRVSPCPPLEQEGLRRLFKLRWRYRGVDFLLIHLLLVLCLLEIPAWCVKDRKCFWECYPDFTRDWHMGIWASLILEGTMLASLVLMALVDMHVCGPDYWKGTKGAHYQVTWFKHGILATYAAIYSLAVIVDFRAHAICDYLRVLLYLSVHRRTMLVVTQIRHILGAVAEIWLLIFLNIVLFAWMGLVLYKDTQEGQNEFTDIFEASWRLFVLFTTTNFPDIMMVAVDSVRASVIYFVGFVILNAFFLAQLSLAFIFNVFRGGQKGIPRMEEDIRLSRSAVAFSLLDDRGAGRVSIANMGAFLLEVHDMRGLACREVARLQDLIEEAGVRRPEEPSLDLDDFKDAVRVMDRSLRHAEWITEIQWYYPRLYQSAHFRRLTRIVKTQRVTLWPGGRGTPRISMLVMDFVDALLLMSSFITLFVAHSVVSESGYVRYDWVQIFVVFGFCITTSLSAVVRGWHNCLQRPAWVFNMVMTIPSFIVLIFAFTYSGRHWGWRVLRALRIAHLSLGIAFVPRLGFLVRTLLIMTRRAATPASVLLVWALFMAVVGTQIFGGMVCVPDLAKGIENCEGTTVANNTYTSAEMNLLNFNDVPTSLLTLFVLFVVNDWYVIVDEFVDVSGTGWARTYFIMNYIVGVAVILNLVITVVINSFWDEYKNSNMPALTLRQLHDAAAASARHDATFPVSGGGGSRNDGTDRFDDRTEGVLGHVSPSSYSGLRESSWGWPHGDRCGRGEVRMTEEESDRRDAETPRSAVESSSQNGSHQLVHIYFPPHVMPEGDQGGMEAERAVARRASRRRLDISGIT